MLISGGYVGHGDGQQSVEIYHPDKQSSCKIPDLPESRFVHTQDGGMLCGGLKSGNEAPERSCRRWNPDTGAWDLEIESLTKERFNHISWTPADGTVTYLIGGSWSSLTSEAIDKDYVVTSSFPLQHWTE